jgi:hypothetical protein
VPPSLPIAINTDHLLANYEGVKNKLYSGQVNGGKLVCGDNDWLFATTFGDLGYTEPAIIADKPISTQHESQLDIHMN